MSAPTFSTAAIGQAVKAVMDDQYEVIDPNLYPVVERDVKIALNAALAVDASRLAQAGIRERVQQLTESQLADIAKPSWSYERDWQSGMRAALLVALGVQ